MRVDVFEFTLKISNNSIENLYIGREYVNTTAIERLYEIQESIQRSFVVEEEI